MKQRALHRAGVIAIGTLVLGIIGCERSGDSGDTSARTTPAPSHAEPALRPSGASGASDRSTPPADPRVAEFSGLTAPVPATWIWQPPEGGMRAANYVLPAIDEGNQAHLVVFHRIGGGVEMNIERWKGQFRTPELREVEPVVSEHEVAGMRMTLVELVGEYQRMGQTWFTPGQTFLGAILEAPGGDLQIRLTGDTDTVNAHREDFMTFLNGIRPADGAAPAPAPAPAPSGY